MWAYLPATLALFVKVWIAFSARRFQLDKKLAAIFWTLLCFLGAIDVLDLMGRYFSGRIEASQGFVDTSLRIYYCVLFCVAGLLVEISVVLRKGDSNRWMRWANLSLVVLMICIMLFTNHLIIGVKSIGYSVTRIPGEHYFLFQLYILTSLFFSIVSCCYGYLIKERHYEKVQFIYVILSVLAMLAPIVFAIFAMKLGIKVNAAVILPIGSTLFLITLTYALNTKGIYNIRVWLPWTKMFKLFVSWHKEFMIYPDRMMSAKERRQLNERRFLIEALMRTDGNQAQAARNLDISPSSMSIKRKFYGI